MDKDKKNFCVEGFISNEETPVITVDDLEVTVTDIKNGVVVGTVNLPANASTPFVPLQWDLTGKVIEEGKAIAESKLNLIFKELSGKDYKEIGKEMLSAISGIQRTVEYQYKENWQERKALARNIMNVVSGFINHRTIERRDKDGNSWETVNKPEWNWDKYEYRVKARPYTQEELVEIMKSGRVLAVENKVSGDVVSVSAVKLTSVSLTELGWITFDKFLEEYLWLDGSTCGVEE